MLHKKGYTLFQGFLLCSTIISARVVGLPQDSSSSTTVKPGRYIPELFGHHLGKYIPDESGKYFHIHRPYDGGYGDRGVKYIHDASGKLVRAPAYGPPIDSDDLLGPKDHLRFMIDFNYDNSGWQIIKFDWLRDGDENYKYKYVNENQLWSTNNGYLPPEKDDKDTSDTNASSSGRKSGESDVHIDGEYNEAKGYNYSYTDEKDNKNLKNAIKEVLDYIEVNILPTL